MKRRLRGIAPNLKTLTTKALGITLDTNGQRRITQGLVGVGPSRSSKAARSTQRQESEYADCEAKNRK
jgi:hypothetical protein